MGESAWPDQPSKILVVDDRAANLLAFQVILEDTGEHVFVAHSGEEALTQVAANDFAVIFLDVNMPGMDGFETARRIRSDPRGASTPIIFLTASADDFHEMEADSHGAIDFIETPVVPGILRAKVKLLAEHYRMRQELEHRRREETRS